MITPPMKITIVRDTTTAGVEHALCELYKKITGTMPDRDTVLQTAQKEYDAEMALFQETNMDIWEVAKKATNKIIKYIEKKQSEGCTDAQFARCNELIAKQEAIQKKLDEKAKRVITRKVHATNKYTDIVSNEASWSKELRICVPSQLVGNNLMQAYSVHEIFNLKDIDARIKTYFEIGVSVEGDEVHYNENGLTGKGAVCRRRSKFWFFPFAPAPAVLSKILDMVDDSATVYICDDNLAHADAVVELEPFVPYAKIKEIGTNSWTPKELNVNSTVSYADMLTTTVCFNTTNQARAWAKTYLKRTTENEFQKNDYVLVLNKDADASNVFVEAGTVWRFHRQDAQGVWVAGANTRIYCLGRNGRVQHSFVRGLDQMRGLPADLPVCTIGFKEPVTNLSNLLIASGFNNVTAYIVSTL